MCIRDREESCRAGVLHNCKREKNMPKTKENPMETMPPVSYTHLSYAASERPDVLLIGGDIYYKAAPSGEAYQVFDHFLEELSGIEPGIPVLIIAGNHDSPERLSYASSFLEKHQIHLSVFPPVKAEEHLKKIVLEDEYGPVAFYLLPFLKPGYVRHLFPEGEVTDYESAVRSILSREEIDRRIRNVLLSHQFYAGRSKAVSYTHLYVYKRQCLRNGN